MLQTKMPCNLNHWQSELFVTNQRYEPAQFRVRELQSVYITNSGIAFTRSGIVKESVYQYSDRQWKYKRSVINHFLFRKIVRVKTGVVVFVHNYYCPGYYHWITEALPRLLAVCDSIEPQQLTLVIPEHYPGYAWESLSFFSFQLVVKMKRNEIVFANRVVFAENPPEGAINNPERTAQLATFFTGTDTPYNGPPKKVYISRRRASRRRISNEDELITMLLQHGFEILETENLSFLEQINYFASASTVMSIHGAGLSNMNFMPPGSTVIELYRSLKRGEYFNMSYWRLASACQHKYHTFWCNPADRDSSFDSSDLVADVTAIENLLRQLEKELV